ncbi:MAG TPA: hypothetical protein VL614_03525 [Acetobacteraceae bacterium]|jgi:hypothetical protein|nr:hypothetical protein [Acetobacteraceae bacterium]
MTRAIGPMKGAPTATERSGRAEMNDELGVGYFVEREVTRASRCSLQAWKVRLMTVALVIVGLVCLLVGYIGGLFHGHYDWVTRDGASGCDKWPTPSRQR